MPFGIMHDLMDSNTDLVRTGFRDNASGYIIRNIYDALDRGIESPQAFRDRLLGENGNRAIHQRQDPHFVPFRIFPKLPMPLAKSALLRVRPFSSSVVPGSRPTFPIGRTLFLMPIFLVVFTGLIQILRGIWFFPFTCNTINEVGLVKTFRGKQGVSAT